MARMTDGNIFYPCHRCHPWFITFVFPVSYGSELKESSRGAKKKTVSITNQILQIRVLSPRQISPRQILQGNPWLYLVSSCTSSLL